MGHFWNILTTSHETCPPGTRDGLIWYVDYECNSYMDEWNFENWGVKYWSRTREFEEYLNKG